MIRRPTDTPPAATRVSHMRTRRSFDHREMFVFDEATQACDFVLTST